MQIHKVEKWKNLSSFQQKVFLTISHEYKDIEKIQERKKKSMELME